MSKQTGPLKPGTILKTVKGEPIRVLSFIAEGGQGFVYRVSWKNRIYALKWYKEEALGKDRGRITKNLDNNIQKGAPNPSFIWPLARTEVKDGTIGYLMFLKPESYLPVSKLAISSIGFSSLTTAVDAALQIVQAFHILHRNGYCYVDVNAENFTVNPQNGNILIIDNDNVAVNESKANVAGTMKFMAPEVVTGKSNPNKETDRFSMAVLLYMLFTKNHPFEGKRHLVPGMTDEMNLELYGSKASFMMENPKGPNGPHKQFHINSIHFWKELPDYMKQLFLRTFTKEGLTNPMTRPTALEWMKGLTRMRSDIVKCSCGEEILTTDGKTVRCPKCYRKAGFKQKIQLPEYAVAAKTGTRIYRCQTGICEVGKGLDPVGMVIENPNVPGLFGLQNMTEESWEVTDQNRTKRTIPGGQVVPLLNGIDIRMKGCSMQIAAAG